jgi:hypothetical protein
VGENGQVGAHHLGHRLVLEAAQQLRDDEGLTSPSRSIKRSSRSRKIGITGLKTTPSRLAAG